MAGDENEDGGSVVGDEGAGDVHAGEVGHIEVEEKDVDGSGGYCLHEFSGVIKENVVGWEIFEVKVGLEFCFDVKANFGFVIADYDMVHDDVYSFYMDGLFVC